MKIILLTTLLLFAGCATDITAGEAHRAVEHGAILLDVRTPEEFAERHIPGAVNIPVTDLKARMSELPRATSLIVYCHTGGRAGAAAIILRKAGYRVQNLGSIGHWYIGEKEAPSTY